jgi:hypothetical protein
MVAVLKDLDKRLSENAVEGGAPAFIEAAKNFVADVQPEVNIGPHHYLLGLVHPKTKRVFEKDRVLREMGRQTEAWELEHVVQHTRPVSEGSPDIFEALNQYNNDEGDSLSGGILAVAVFALISRIPNE